MERVGLVFDSADSKHGPGRIGAVSRRGFLADHD
jgi:hypothetical protein